MKFNMTRRQSVKALAAGTVAFALSAGMTFAENADVKIGFTPKFLKDDFQTLMLDLSKKAFDASSPVLIDVTTWVNIAATCMNSPVMTGYSSGWPPGGVCR